MIGLFAALLLAAAEPHAPPAPAAAPQTAASAPDAKAQPAKSAKADVICWEETPVGTHFSRKVCGTREELDRLHRQAQDYLNRPRGIAPGAIPQ